MLHIDLCSSPAKSLWGQTAFQAGEEVCWQTSLKYLSWCIIHPGKLTWNTIVKVWKMIFLFILRQFLGSITIFRGVSWCIITILKPYFINLLFFFCIFSMEFKQLWCQVHVLICTSGIAQLFFHDLGSESEFTPEKGWVEYKPLLFGNVSF